MAAADDRTAAGWFAALEDRFGSQLTHRELSRSIRSLSHLYVEKRRGGIAAAARDGAGKRAAFALFYAPLHFRLVHGIVGALDTADPPPGRVVDLGCGTGAAGAAWAMAAGGVGAVHGIDRSAWAVGEACWTYRWFGLRGTARRRDLNAAAMGGRRTGTVAAFVVNELSDRDRTALLGGLLRTVRRGGRVLVVEPLARRVCPWWPEWEAEICRQGGRADEWRFAAAMPSGWRALDHSAGLDHSEATGRSLWLAPAVSGPAA